MFYSDSEFTRVNYDDKEITKTTYKDYNGRSDGSFIAGGSGKQNTFVISMHPHCSSTCPCEAVVCAFLCCTSEMTAFLSGQNELMSSIEGPHLFCFIKGKDFITVGKIRAPHSKKSTKMEIHNVTSPGIYYIDSTNKLKTSLKLTSKFHPIFIEWLVENKCQYKLALRLFSELLNIDSNKSTKNRMTQNCAIVFSAFFLSNCNTSVVNHKFVKSCVASSGETPVVDKDPNLHSPRHKKRKLSFDH